MLVLSREPVNTIPVAARPATKLACQPSRISLNTVPPVLLNYHTAVPSVLTLMLTLTNLAYLVEFYHV